MACYPLDKLRIKYHDKRAKPYVLVYQQGRVGSTSVYESLCESNISLPIFHVHTFCPTTSLETISKCKAERRRVARYQHMGLLIGRSLEHRRATARPEPAAYIVNIVRDPIAVMLSLWFMKPKNSLKVNWNASESEIIDACMSQFIEMLDRDDPTRWAICNWHDHVFLPETGIDVYKNPFDHEKGYTIIKSQGYKVVLFRLEDVKHTFQHGISDLLGIDSSRVVFHHRNLHRDHQHAGVFEKVKKSIRISPEVCDKVYDTNMVRHFYSDQLIEKMRTRWTG